MLSKYRFRIVCAMLSLLLILSLVLLERAAAAHTPKILASYLLSEDGSKRSISFPFVERSPVDFALHEWIVELEWHEGDTTRLCIVFIGGSQNQMLESIAVNGIDVPEDMYSSVKKPDGAKRYIVDFAPSLVDGQNEIQILTLIEDVRYFGISLENAESLDSPLQIAVLVVCILLVLALVFLILHRFKVDRILIILILLALVWQLLSLAVRDYRSYGYDLFARATGHVNYIQHIVDTGSLPPPHGWSYYHPPLYYTLAAGVYSAAKVFGITDPFKPLQMLALVFWWIFLAYSLRLLAQFTMNPWIYRAAAALLLFWPAGSLAAIRLGNDALLYPLFMIALFYGHRWFVGEKWRDLLIASIVCGIGFFAKVSIFPLAGIFGGLILWRLYKKYTTLSLRQALTAIAVIAGCFFLSAIDKWHYELKIDYHPKWYMAPFSNLSLGTMADDWYTDNKVLDFIVPNPKAWFDGMYVKPWWDDKAGRANLWNFLGKTAMYSELDEAYAVRRDSFREQYLAPVMNVVLIFLFVLGCYGLPLFWRRRSISRAPLDAGLSAGGAPGKVPAERGRLGKWLACARAESQKSDFRLVLAVAVFFLLLLVATRIFHPTPSQGDFRYLIPLLPVIAAAVAGGIMRLAERGWRRCFVAANVLVGCFVLASLLFYLGI